MKKKHIAAIAVTAALLCAGVAYGVGGTPSDPLVSLNYLNNTYQPSLKKQVDDQVENAVSASYNKAAAKADSIAGGGSKTTSVSVTQSRGDTVTLSEGSVIFLAAGTVSLSGSGGVVIDATTAGEGANLSMTAGHRYIVGEGARGTATVVSDAAVFLVEGDYSSKASGQKATPFTDLVSTSWYYSYATYTYENGLLNGTSSTTFEPNSPVTRAMLATILYRMAGSPSVSSAPPFSDVPAGQWYSDPITWAAGKGVVKGVGGNLFAPTDNVTREQMALMLQNYAVTCKGASAGEAADLSGFTDVNAVSGWADKAISWAVAKGILTGNADGTIAPGGNATRAQVCTVIQRCQTVYP